MFTIKIHWHHKPREWPGGTDVIRELSEQEARDIREIYMGKRYVSKVEIEEKQD